MTLNDPLANALSVVLSSEQLGRSECLVKPISTLIKSVFNVLKDSQYLGEYEEIQEGRGNHIRIHLLGTINKCGVIKPRISVKKDGFENFEKRYLPAKDVGILFVSTPLGVLPHPEAKKKSVGGRLLAYCY